MIENDRCRIEQIKTRRSRSVLLRPDDYIWRLECRGSVMMVTAIHIQREISHDTVL